MDIAIRRAEPDDYEGVWRTFQDESVYSGTLQTPFTSQEQWRKRLSEHGDADYMLVACAGAQIVGHAGLHPLGKSPRRAHAMTLGIGVTGPWQRKGVGTALMGALVELADNWLNVFRLELTVYADNQPAIALYRKFGFEQEGVLRCYALRGGRYVDAYFMGRLRPKSMPV
ncbi:MAG TPA: GNAT family N-acetyltransferase [Usitatibacter sp.]|nr:GNAT family N-acetyltransferase [Usitatibacter sp.]